MIGTNSFSLYEGERTFADVDIGRIIEMPIRSIRGLGGGAGRWWCRKREFCYIILDEIQYFIQRDRRIWAWNIQNILLIRTEFAPDNVLA